MQVGGGANPNPTMKGFTPGEGPEDPTSGGCREAEQPPKVGPSCWVGNDHSEAKSRCQLATCLPAQPTMRAEIASQRLL